jgi:hypothetical protein
MYRVAPVCRGELDNSALEKSVGDLVMLFRGKLRLHRRICEASENQIAAKARLVEVHCVGTVAIE